MGPYKSYPPYDPPQQGAAEAATQRPTLDDIDGRLQRGELDLDADEALALLVQLKRARFRDLKFYQPLDC
ncbi:hypothetical protein C435_03453 [Haloarcula marismortui ATCC 33799]|uniref:Uncharacterized protein n=1 Tax=Haloarcula marismortui ATCC 33799 TaxID=662475 RepID=M0KSU2_9EURY|nr:hypothetical protein C435_03453 [Haloarcula californiae ATCC 33799]